VFAGSNILLAILFRRRRATLRGVPIGLDGGSAELFTDFRATGHVGTLDWYTLLLAVFALVCGARRVVSEGEDRGTVEERSARFRRCSGR
jgi:hypothetical protein